jgi:hypothetical protein
MSRRLELLLMVLVVTWLAGDVWLALFEPLSPNVGAGFGFCFLVVAVLLGVFDVITREPNPRVVVAYFATLSATTLVGYRAFAAATVIDGFRASDLLLLVLAVVILFTLVAARWFRPDSVLPASPEGDERHDIERGEVEGE